jgi:hypothetical protein
MLWFEISHEAFLGDKAGSGCQNPVNGACPGSQYRVRNAPGPHRPGNGLLSAKQFFELIVERFVDLILQLFLQLLTANGLEESRGIRLWCRDGAAERDRNGTSAGSLFFQRHIQSQLQLLIQSHCTT